MNKKGSGEAVMFFAFMLVMLIITGGIVTGVFMFFGKGFDFRGFEAKVLFDKVSVCLEGNDFFDEKFNIYSDCGFSNNIDEDHLIYVMDKSSGEEFYKGVLDYKNQCFLDSAKKNRNFPLCVRDNLIINGKNFEVIVGSNQNSRRVFK